MMNRKAIRKKSVIVLMVVLQIMPKVDRLIVKVLGQQNVKREIFPGAIASALKTFLKFKT